MGDILIYENKKVEKSTRKRKEILDGVEQYDIKDLMINYEEKEKRENVDYTILKEKQDKDLKSFLMAEKKLSEETNSILEKWKKEGFNPFWN